MTNSRKVWACSFRSGKSTSIQHAKHPNSIPTEAGVLEDAQCYIHNQLF